MNRYLLGVVTQSIRGGCTAHSPIFNCLIEYTHTLLEFYMYARYKCHDDATLRYISDCLHRFHALNDLILLGRASKQLKATAKSHRMELMKKRIVDEEREC
jgi:hypothetical protein